MKLIFILVLVQALALMTIVRAERKSSSAEIITKITPSRKPVVVLQKKIVAATPKIPEERKKLSIFPKNPAKYVVTSKPYAQVRKYTPRPTLMTKKTLMPVYKPSVTTKEPVTVRPSSRSLDAIVDWPTEVPEFRIHRILVEEKDVNYNTGYKIIQSTVLENDNQIKDDSEEISTGLPEFEDDLTNGLDNNVLVDSNTLSESDNLQTKRLALHGPTIHDSWYFKNVARVPTELFHDVNDEEEFIFLNENQKKSTNSAPKLKSSRSMKSSDSNPTAVTSRSKRSNNIIEEENRVTTASALKFTGREPRITDDLVFKNIHA